MRNLFLIMFCLSSYLLNGQQKLNNTGVVTYEETNIYGRKTIVQLFFSNEKSIYISNRGTKSRVNKLANGETLDTHDDAKLMKQLMSGSMIYPYYFDEEGDVIYMNWKSDSLIFRQVLKHDPIIVVEPNLPKINWKTTRESKKIGIFVCFKAIATFRGRNYQAWFTPDLPIPSGPWKLHGLPGLILEAQDSQAEYKYIFQSIEIPLKDQAELSKTPKTGDIIPLSQYDTMLKQKEEEYVRKISSKAAARGMSLSVLPDDKIKQELNYER